MASKEHRLRKYLKRKRRAKTSEKFNDLARLYWRYHFQVYGSHKLIWNQDED